MKRYIINTIKIVSFLFILGYIMIFLGRAFCPSVLSEGRSHKKIFAREKNIYKIFYTGNCHSYSTFRPTVIRDITDLRGFSLGAANMIGPDEFYLIEAAMKNQDISIMVLETFPFIIYDSYVEDTERYSHAFYSEMPLKTRFKYVKDQGMKFTDFDWIYYIFDVTYFHDRWDKNNSFGLPREATDNGWLEYHTIKPLKTPEELLSFPVSIERGEIDSEYLNSFLKILSYLEERNVKVILTTAPYTGMTENEVKRLNTLKDIANEKSIPYLDFTSQELIEELQLQRRYMIDKNHVNKKGAKIISTYLAQFLLDNGYCQ